MLISGTSESSASTTSTEGKVAESILRQWPPLILPSNPLQTRLNVLALQLSSLSESLSFILSPFVYHNIGNTTNPYIYDYIHCWMNYLALMITFPNMQPSWLTDGAVNQRNHLKTQKKQRTRFQIQSNVIQSKPILIAASNINNSSDFRSYSTNTYGHIYNICNLQWTTTSYLLGNHSAEKHRDFKISKNFH